MHSRLATLLERYPPLKSCATDIAAAAKTLEDSFRSGGKLLLCGNGGSAADSDHIAGELLKGFGHARTLPAADAKLLGGDLAKNLQGALPAIPLPSVPTVKIPTELPTIDPSTITPPTDWSTRMPTPRVNAGRITTAQ